MEGFEAINFSTKQLLQTHSNHRGNVCVQAMVRMAHQFINHNHDVESVLKKQKKQKQKIMDRIKQIYHGTPAMMQRIGPVII